MGEARTALQMVTMGFDEAPFLDELRTTGAEEAASEYVQEKQYAFEWALDFIQKHVNGEFNEGAAIFMTGPMRSGKTLLCQAIGEQLFKEGLVESITRVSTLVDTRSIGEIKSRSGCVSYPCQVIENSDVDTLCEDPGVLLLEEIQFWDPKILAKIVRARTRSGRITVLSGLDLDYTGKPWRSADAIAELIIQLTDQLGIAHLHSICDTCHQSGAELTQLKVPDEDGNLVLAPSNLFGGPVVPEAADLKFMPQCDKHHQIGSPIDVDL